MFGDGALTFQEFAMREQLPLAEIHDALLDFMRGRDDGVLYGAQAVNAYVMEARMTQDVDIASTQAKELAKDLRKFLNERFHIAMRIREVKDNVGFRLFQVRKPQNRHLVGVRNVEALPPAQRVRRVLVVTPPELIANKVVSMVARQQTPKGFIDHADLGRLLLTFPDLKVKDGEVAECLRRNGAERVVMDAWNELVAQKILPNNEDDKFSR